MILSDTEIEAAMDAGDIVIEPYDPTCLGGNSYDVHLSPWLLVYAPERQFWHNGRQIGLLDARRQTPAVEMEIPPEGYVLVPGQLYLGSTVEYTETHRHLPDIDGKSSLGRMGLAIHVTAGRGDVGFCNHWTLEISVVGGHAVRVYAGMKIGQLRYHQVAGEVRAVYSRKDGAKYTDCNPKPQPSRMWRNFQETP